MTTMTHSRIKSVQQAITSVLAKRGERGATLEGLEAYKDEMFAVWGHDSIMNQWLGKLDVNQYVK